MKFSKRWKPTYLFDRKRLRTSKQELLSKKCLPRFVFGGLFAERLFAECCLARRPGTRPAIWSSANSMQLICCALRRVFANWFHRQRRFSFFCLFCNPIKRRFASSTNSTESANIHWISTAQTASTTNSTHSRAAVLRAPLNSHEHIVHSSPRSRCPTQYKVWVSDSEPTGPSDEQPS